MNLNIDIDTFQHVIFMLSLQIHQNKTLQTRSKQTGVKSLLNFKKIGIVQEPDQRINVTV